MSERPRESVSALMDGEAGELELRRLLTDSDQLSVRSCWQSYHRLRVVLKDEPVEFLDWDISERVSSAIEDTSKGAPIARRRPSWLSPVGSFSVAASVAAAVVMTVGNLTPVGTDIGEGRTAMLSRVFPATGGLAVSATGNANPVSLTTQTAVALPVSDSQADKDARKRLDQYILRHTESAALNNGQGMISFARVANFDVE